MHNAPSVSYPVGRSHIQGLLHGLLWLMGAAALAVWGWQVDVWGWRQTLVLVALAGAGAAAVQDWRRTPEGDLRWDGQQWFWATIGPPCTVHLLCRLDLQSHMLLYLRPELGKPCWCWAVRSRQPQHWHGLRRAVYSPARLRPDPDGVLGSEP